jgi:hypothetical protein
VEVVEVIDLTFAVSAFLIALLAEWKLKWEKDKKQKTG